MLTHLSVDTGANASAEEAEEGTEDAKEKVNNVVHTFRLVSTQFDKKSYLTHLKGMNFQCEGVFEDITRMRLLKSVVFTGYMKAVKEAKKSSGASEEDIAAFEKGAGAYAKKIVANFKDYEFYTGESMNPDGMYALQLPQPPAAICAQRNFS